MKGHLCNMYLKGASTKLVLTEDYDDGQSEDEENSH